MPINTTHPYYQRTIGVRQRCRDVCDGEDAVKARGPKYLPVIGTTDADYESYRNRAMFFNATERALGALTGAVMQKEPVVDGEFPEEWEDNIDDSGTSFEQFSTQLVKETLEVGYQGLMVDRNGDSRPFLRAYTAESIVNWRYKDGDLIMVVLKEAVQRQDPTDPYIVREEDQYRELFLDQAGYYVVRVHTKKAGMIDASKGEYEYTETVPTFRGKRLDFIPFVMDPNMPRPPIADLASVNIAHYRNSADLEHGRHFTALPTPYVTGVREDPTNPQPLKIGSMTAWLLPEPSCSAGYVEFSGAGLSALSDGLKEKERMMAVLGARLLSEQRKGVESADALRIRAGGESMALTTVSNVCSALMSKAMSWMVWWDTGAEGSIDVEFNEDFINDKLDYQTIAAYVDAWLKGAISQDTLLFNLKRGDVLPPDTSVEDEKALIDMERSNPTRNAMPANGTQPTQQGQQDNGTQPTQQGQQDTGTQQEGD